MVDLAPETLLAVEIARILHAADLGVYRDQGAYQATEHGILIDQESPTTLERYTLVTPLTTLSEGRADMVYRVQLAHRVTRDDEHPAIDVARGHVHAVARVFDHAERTPAILGISWAEEYSSTVFDPDTQDRVTATQSFLFRGRRS